MRRFQYIVFSLLACVPAVWAADELTTATVDGVATAERRVPLLNVSKGRLPNDTALEKQTKLTIEDAPKELGGKALKVVYAGDDSFGMSRGASERNWKPFAAVEFTAFNPSGQNVKLSFAVRHR